MSIKDELFAFEEKYPFLYNEMVGGVSVYTCLRDNVAAKLETAGESVQETRIEEKGKIYIRRILASWFKWNKFKKAQTVIFTSSVYRRDKGRNLAAEYLIQKYPNAVVFEWPSRNDAFDKAYFKDSKKYVPIDAYLIQYKLYCKLHRKKIQKMTEECRNRLRTEFAKSVIETESERRAVTYLIEALPETVVATTISQQIFARKFRKYKNIEYAVDFWGSGRENIIPVLQGEPQSIELQHGLITSTHPGYVYPKFVEKVPSQLFDRILLVYGEKTKKILCEDSIYSPAQVEVVGNPRLQRYKQLFEGESRKRKWILFSSQTFEQDGTKGNYYDTVIPLLRALAERIKEKGEYELAIKLHPRENKVFAARYKAEIPECIVLDNSVDLYEALSETYFHLTATSTVLFEAAEFGVPTAMVQFADYTAEKTFGFDVLTLKDEVSIEKLCGILFDDLSYKDYQEKIIKEARKNI